MRVTYPLLLLLIFFLPGAHSQTSKRIAVIGSSTSACYGFSGIPPEMAIENCYINKLISFYEGKGYTIHRRLLAISGTNVYQGMPTGWPEIFLNGVGYSPNPEYNISKAIENPKPDAVIVNYPTNGYIEMTVHEVMLYLRTIKKAANDAGVPCYITTTQPRNDFNLTTRTKLQEIRDSIYLQFGIYAVDFWSVVANPDGTINPTYQQAGDLIHINQLGHNLFFERVRDENVFNLTVPVRLSEFTVRTSQNDVLIRWAVQEESAGTNYRIQRSEDGVQFEDIYESTSNKDNTNRTYNYTDKKAVEGTHFYRLAITEHGVRTYSKVQKIFGGWPVTVRSIAYKQSSVWIQTIASRKQMLNLRIVNSTGIVIGTYSRTLEAGINTIVIDKLLTARGIYWIEGRNGNARVFLSPFVPN